MSPVSRASILLRRGRASAVVHILFRTRGGRLGYPTLISLTNLSTFPYEKLRRGTLSVSIISVIGLKKTLG